MSKILVTGGAGFIGSNLVIELLKQNHDITIIDNISSGNKHHIDFFSGKFLNQDISTNFTLDENFDIIFHEASLTDTTFKDDNEMIRQNVEGFQNILNLALKHNSTLVYASSAGVYGNGPTPMKEDQEKQPLNAYAKSKHQMDLIAAQHFDKLNIVGLRYFNVFGPREHYKGTSSSMIWQLAQQMISGRNPRIFKMGEQVRDHIYVKDVVKATILASKLNKSGIFNVGTGVATTFNDVIKCLNSTLNMNKEPEYFDNPYTEVYQNNTQAHTEKSTPILGFTPDFTIQKGIDDYFGKNE
jgi:ADP-L-glycero-D-manno-heptose 6-epimerase|tara:strand:- start:6351 stop:7244 length:894 start_codon:yes stop_codon:yes gene_type:complete